MEEFLKAAVTQVPGLAVLAWVVVWNQKANSKRDTLSANREALYLQHLSEQDEAHNEMMKGVDIGCHEHSSRLFAQYDALSRDGIKVLRENTSMMGEVKSIMGAVNTSLIRRNGGR